MRTVKAARVAYYICSLARTTYRLLASSLCKATIAYIYLLLMYKTKC